jgi:L-ascorbate metabolism protein UlaG (beta-lactamase superfamily)
MRWVVPAILLNLFLFAGDLARSQQITDPSGDSFAEDIKLVQERAGSYDNVDEVCAGIPDGFLDAIDANALVDWIKRGFEENPQNRSSARNPSRDLLFTALDVAAIASAESQFAPLVEYRIETTRKVYSQLKNNLPPQSGLVIYKLYNEGTILRSRDVTIAIDLVLHPENGELARGFAEMVDGLLVSHVHGDHYDRGSQLYPELEKAGKPLILPELDESVPLGGILKSAKIENAQWTAFRGAHLSLRFSSFYLVEVGRWKILHSGDNTIWMDFARSEFAKDVDIFLLKPESIYIEPGEEENWSWPGDMQEAMIDTLREIRPHLVIPHHLLEFGGHSLGAYGHDMGLRLYQQVPDGVEVQLLHWGESLHFNR